MATPFSVYLVDDNPWHVEPVRCLLDEEAFTLTHWHSPRDAWNGINESIASDLVILDLDVEGEGSGGLAFADLIDHLRVRWPQVPLIVLSGQLDTDTVMRSRTHDVRAVVRKPYDIRYLLTTIYGILRDGLDAHIHELNRQHVQLTREFHRLQAQETPVQTQVNRALQLLSRHFRFEEDFMATHAYPQAREHKAAHDKLLLHAQALTRGGAVRAEAIGRFWRGVESDINDDAGYLAYLEGIHEQLSARLLPR
ncbi:MAG: response regulator [Gammaproteobacteria bacterium]|nr:response regulator [Gammaproteobacteria bacterium]